MVNPLSLNRQITAPDIPFNIVKEYPHDPFAFTEGLEFHDGFLFESTGGDKSHLPLSTLRRVRLNTGKPLEIIPVHPSYFAEGLTIFGQKLFQLTDKSRIALVYDLNDLRPTKNHLRYDGWDRGWGLTHDNKHLILSDSKQIHFVDPVTFKIIRTIPVKDGSTTVERLNELDYAAGFIYANLFPYDLVLRIDPRNGEVLGKIDLSAFRPCRTCVTNGIAHNEKTGHLYVTGKKWPKVLEISFV